MLTERTFAQSALYLMENTEYIPCKLSVCHHGFIRKAVNLLKRDFVAVKAADYSSAARCAEVYGKRFQFFIYVFPFRI